MGPTHKHMTVCVCESERGHEMIDVPPNTMCCCFPFCLPLCQAAGDGSSGSVKRTTGTAVTAATFAAWWAAFDAQRTAEGKAKTSTKKPTGTVVALHKVCSVWLCCLFADTGGVGCCATGRQLFETDSSLATSDAGACCCVWWQGLRRLRAGTRVETYHSRPSLLCSFARGCCSIACVCQMAESHL